MGWVPVVWVGRVGPEVQVGLEVRVQVPEAEAERVERVEEEVQRRPLEFGKT